MFTIAKHVEQCTNLRVKRREALLCVLGGRWFIPEEKRVSKPTLTNGITLETISLTLVCYLLFISVSPLETYGLFVACDDFSTGFGITGVLLLL